MNTKSALNSLYVCAGCLTLGLLTTKLAEIQRDGGGDKPVYCSWSGKAQSGRTPREFRSYRGIPEILALSTTLPRSEGPTSVSSLLTKSVKADGDTFSGWKGGAFRMDHDTPIMMAAADETSDIALSDVVEREHDVLLIKKVVDLW